ncbi:MAG: PDZ domain-containing protein, partial [Pirellulaceae bacterium]|nr:PDZ domain-containing protein [Pirellulaceae bacterium]
MANKNNFSFIIFMTLGFVGLVIVQTYFFKPELPDASVEKTAKQTNDVDGAEEAKATDAETKAQEPAEARPDLEREFLTLGSFDPEGNPLVVTLDTRGGTLRRVELNERNASGGYKYSDVDYRNAWIGQLELEEQEDGIKVGLVIPGTPAADAGLAVGDVIQMVNEETVMVPAEAVEVSESETEPQPPATRLQRFDR